MLIFSNIKKLILAIKNGKKTLRGKLILYFVLVILSLFSVFMLLLLLTDNVMNPRKQIESVLSYQLQNTYDEISIDMDAFTGYGIQLSKDLGREIEQFLQEEKLELEDLNNNPEKLMEVQKIMYSGLNTTIRLGCSSGVFAVIDATVNTDLPEADSSRSGVYLRLKNVYNSVIINPETVLFRGNADVAHHNGLELHNRWNMEISTDLIPGYDDILNGTFDGEYYWTKRFNLPSTWEGVVMLCIPIKDGRGNVLGVCGIELNDTHFSMHYPVVPTEYGSVVTAITPVEDNNLMMSLGEKGNTEGTWLSGSEVLQYTRTKIFDEYSDGNKTYYGISQSIPLYGKDAESWVVSQLISGDGCDEYIMRQRFIRIIMLTCFITAMIICVLRMSRRYVQPILSGLDDIREGQMDSENVAQISELEELKQWMKEWTKEQEERKESTETVVVTELPPNILEVLDRFSDAVHTLTKAEYNIYKFYVEGHEIADIPEIAFVSMSTIKHNSNIYKKLGITSYSELMLYIDLFRRCDRLDSIIIKEMEE